MNMRDIPLQSRLMPVASVNAAARTIEVVWSTGADVQRMDPWTGERYVERLSMDPAHVDLSRLERGAPLLDTHGRYRLSDVIGVVEKAWIVGTEGRALVRFSDREAVEPIWRDVQAGIIRNVSVAYAVRKYEITKPADGRPVWRAIDWEPHELSFVPVGADAGAGSRSADKPGQALYRCEFIDTDPAGSDLPKERNMTKPNPATGAVPAEQPDPEAHLQQAAADATRAATRRADDIALACRAHKLPMERFVELLNSDKSAERIARELNEAAVGREEETPTRSGLRIETLVDETETRREAMAEAILHRVMPGAALPDRAREYRHFSLLRLAEETLTAAGTRIRGMAPMQIAERAMMATSDFPAILANVMNKRLRAAYAENQPSYRRWARRAPNAPDFKTLTVTQLSGAPDLLPVPEGGEFKQGRLSDGKETYAMATYGRKIVLSRQAIVNDDLNAFDRFPLAFSAAAARLENRLVYAQLTANAALSDGDALFHANHANLGTGGAISATTLTEARKLMRKQKGLQSEELNITPAYIIVPAALEQVAYQFTSSNYVPAKPSDVNEFRAGGRTALEPIVEAILDANSATAWYLAASPMTSGVDTVEYCYLDGAEGVYLESQMGFDTDGVQLKARSDFVAKAIDFRGLVKNVGV